MSEKELGTLDAMFERCIPVPESGCWAWLGEINCDGYGIFSHSGKPRRAHRVSYEASKGPIPAGLQIDHKCRVRLCINPDHLDAVTSIENTMRGFGPTAVNARKIQCWRGHSLSGENLYIRPDGERECRECKRRQSLEYYYRARRALATQATATQETK